MKLTFLGATQTVTGSKYLIEERGKNYLIDCGLFQGRKELRLKNREPFPLAPEDIDSIILTHAHLDHSGYIPLFIKQGFKGKIYASEATFDLCSVILPDSGHIQEEDARLANKYGFSKHSPAEPLYTEQEAWKALEFFETVDFGKKIPLYEELSFTFSRAGHILGSAFVTLRDFDTTLTFTGDLGRPHDPIIKHPAQLQETDYLVLESTYGNRLHAQSNPVEQLQEIIQTTFSKGGSVIVPAFAVGRAQLLLYLLYTLKKDSLIPDFPIYLDSPMAQNATRIMSKHKREHHLTEEESRKICASAEYVQTFEDSRKLHSSPLPSVIISASGMATGGRILHHLEHYAPNPNNTLVFTGFQAPGTRGDHILKGDREIKIHGHMVPIRARVVNLENTSSHADYSEIEQWLGNFRSSPREVFLTHGELQASLSLKSKIEEHFGWKVSIPEFQQTIDL